MIFLPSASQGIESLVRLIDFYKFIMCTVPLSYKYRLSWTATGPKARGKTKLALEFKKKKRRRQREERHVLTKLHTWCRACCHRAGGRSSGCEWGIATRSRWTVWSSKGCQEAFYLLRNHNPIPFCRSCRPFKNYFQAPDRTKQKEAKRLSPARRPSS